QVVRITIVVQVHTDREGELLTNVATVNADQEDPTPEDAGDTVETPLMGLADLIVTKLASPNPVVAGETLLYTIQVRNDGPSDAANVLVTDTLPAGVTLINYDTSPASIFGNQLTWNLGELAAGETATIQLEVEVASWVTQTLTNNVSTSSDTPDPDPENSDLEDTEVVQVADLELTKRATPTAYAGQTISYTLEVYNHGPSDASNVRVTDALPAGVTFLDASNECSHSNGTVICTTPILALDSNYIFTITVQTNTDLEPGSSLENAAIVSADPPDDDPVNDSDNADTSIVGAADLLVTKSVETDPVIAGQNMTYTLTVENLGPSKADDVMLVDVLPDAVTYVSAAPAPESGPDPLVWNLATLNPGDIRTITVVVNVPPDVLGSITNSVYVESITPDPIPENNLAIAPAPVQGLADLAIAKTADVNPAVIGEELVYMLVITNSGPSDAQTVIVSDTLPQDLGFISAEPAQTSGPNPLIWNLGVVAAGETRQITVRTTVLLTASEYITNPAIVLASTPDPDPEDNESSVTLPVIDMREADVSIFKSDSHDPVEMEDVLTYTLTIQNAGPDPAENVVVTDTLPPEVTFMHAIPAPESEPDPLVWNLGTLQVGQVKQIQVVVRINSWAVNPFTNSASVGSSTVDPNPGNNDDVETTTPGVPTAPMLLYFREGDFDPSSIKLEWTVVEVNVSAYRIYRALTNDLDQAELIHTESAGGDSSEYTFVIHNTLPLHGEWWYWLEIVDAGGEAVGVPHGPVQVTRFLISLPIVLKE
ncbi:MAG: DUF11 domain-containing protein, partial [Anaerolineales bacterium]|nr:DUF11 domain-containing protein [Anaerolineales bacterium]